MTERERRGRVRVCEDCDRTWLAFGLRGERCVWCRPSIPDDARRLSFDALDELPERDGGRRAQAAPRGD